MMSTYSGRLIRLEDSVADRVAQILDLRERLAAQDVIINTVVRQKDAAVAELRLCNEQLKK
jgi:biotin synthase-like enzyme